MGWVRATGHSDPYGKWLDESFAYDGNTGSGALTDPAIPEYSDGSYLELTHSAMPCSKVRFYLSPPYAAAFTVVNVKVYWGGAWHQFYVAFAKNVWIEVSLGGGVYSVTKMRLNFHNNGPGPNNMKIMEVEFFAPSLPTVSIQAVSNIGEISATGNGNITATGGATCTKRGVCWNTTGNPTVAGNKSEQTGSFGTGAFSRPMTGLTRGQKYYVRAYAYHLVGYGYSSQVEFVTKPAITTHNPSDIVRVDPSKVIANGLIETGTENITTRGFKYGLTEIDTWNKSETGTFSSGTFSLQITGLDPDTIYYIRAYIITESWGTLFGAYKQFKTEVPYWSKKTEIKAEATASPEDVKKVGGKRTLPINNHLIQTMGIAQNIANAYLAEYKDQKITMVVDRPIPLPYEIGDTIEQIDSGSRDLMIRKINLRFSAGNFIGTIELEG
jgi:hypothetical protein